MKHDHEDEEKELNEMLLNKEKGDDILTQDNDKTNKVSIP